MSILAKLAWSASPASSPLAGAEPVLFEGPIRLAAPDKVGKGSTDKGLDCMVILFW